MAIIRTIKCSSCGFTLLQGTGTALYVKKKPGFLRRLFGLGERKTILPDPPASGAPAVRDLVGSGRLGSSSAYFCQACHATFSLDSDAARQCSACISTEVTSVFEMVGQKCPKCADGVFEDKRLGMT
jgi:phage FluMu protein Com